MKIDISKIVFLICFTAWDRNEKLILKSVIRKLISKPRFTNWGWKIEKWQHIESECVCLCVLKWEREWDRKNGCVNVLWGWLCLCVGACEFVSWWAYEKESKRERERKREKVCVFVWERVHSTVRESTREVPWQPVREEWSLCLSLKSFRPSFSTLRKKVLPRSWNFSLKTLLLWIVNNLLFDAICDGKQILLMSESTYWQR